MSGDNEVATSNKKSETEETFEELRAKYTRDNYGWADEWLEQEKLRDVTRIKYVIERWSHHCFMPDDVISLVAKFALFDGFHPDVGKQAVIIKAGQLLSTSNRYPDCNKRFPCLYWQMRAGKNGWGIWYPGDKMVGKIVHVWVPHALAIKHHFKNGGIEEEKPQFSDLWHSYRDDEHVYMLEIWAKVEDQYLFAMVTEYGIQVKDE